MASIIMNENVHIVEYEVNCLLRCEPSCTQHSTTGIETDNNGKKEKRIAVKHSNRRRPRGQTASPPPTHYKQCGKYVMRRS
jgi:hypothetical protein